jgi:hypothetical protein
VGVHESRHEHEIAKVDVGALGQLAKVQRRDDAAFDADGAGPKAV